MLQRKSNKFCAKCVNYSYPPCKKCWECDDMANYEENKEKKWSAVVIEVMISGIGKAKK